MHNDLGHGATFGNNLHLGAFDLFKYDFENPGNKMPVGEIDLDEVHAKLGD